MPKPIATRSFVHSGRVHSVAEYHLLTVLPSNHRALRTMAWRTSYQRGPFVQYQAMANLLSRVDGRPCAEVIDRPAPTWFGGVASMALVVLAILTAFVVR